MEMDLNREHWRAMIYYDYKSGLTQQESVDRLMHAFGDIAPSRATVFNWFDHFRRGRRSLEDECRSGRPQTSTTEGQVAAVKALVEEDARVTVSQIQFEVGISSGSVVTILHEKLHLSKISARWVPHHLTQEQKEARVEWCRTMLRRFDNGRSNGVWEIISGDETWIYVFDPETKQQSAQWVEIGNPPPQKFRRERSAAKQMAAVFVAKSGHVCTVPLDTQRTVTAAWYTTVCLPRLLHAVAARRPRTGHRGVLLHHDNAPAHRAGQTQQFLKEKGVQQLQHPPYSPDLAPCDFFVFPTVKKQLRGVRFESPEAAVEAFDKAMKEVPQTEWAGCFDKWFQRMQRCIATKGEYFEKL